MPANAVALELLADTGPLAVSSANLTGKPAAHTVTEARNDLGDSVSVYLDGGEVGAEHAGSAEPGSTIVDATELLREGGKLRIRRHGVIGDDVIREIVGADRCE
jgi:tRNA A37 threonylcarbamoyladenosine synthetase subunit TsaC/SUA5/YrdC